MSPTATTDRAAALRAAVRRVGGERGLHGASMSQIAARAGVAVGTAYVHYTDKDDLVLAAYVEAKQALAAAALATLERATDDGVVEDADHRAAFVALWTGAYRHMLEHRTDALFVLQVDVSPYAEEGHARVLAAGEQLTDHLASSGMGERLLDLPIEALYELGLAPAIRLAARDVALSGDDLLAIADACWRAVRRD